MMAEKSVKTAFVLVTGATFAATIYDGAPMPPDLEWGDYRAVVTHHLLLHIFTKGGTLRQGALDDLISAIEFGRTRKVDLYRG